MRQYLSDSFVDVIDMTYQQFLEHRELQGQVNDVPCLPVPSSKLYKDKTAGHLIVHNRGQPDEYHRWIDAVTMPEQYSQLGELTCVPDHHIDEVMGDVVVTTISQHGVVTAHAFYVSGNRKIHIVSKSVSNHCDDTECYDMIEHLAKERALDSAKAFFTKLEMFNVARLGNTGIDKRSVRHVHQTKENEIRD